MFNFGMIGLFLLIDCCCWSRPIDLGSRFLFSFGWIIIWFFWEKQSRFVLVGVKSWLGVNVGAGVFDWAKYNALSYLLSSKDMTSVFWFYTSPNAPLVEWSIVLGLTDIFVRAFVISFENYVTLEGERTPRS